jgi:N-acetylated-alpha-linked acidic dipeptidase
MNGVRRTRSRLLATLLLGPAALGPAAAESRLPSGTDAAAGHPSPDVEEILQQVPSAESFGRHLLYLAEEPHPTGSARNMELAAYVRDRFREYGLDEVHFHDTPALVGRGRSASVELLQPVELELKLAEEPFPEDKDSYLYADPTTVPFHEYAASGTVTAEVVYANGGSPEDFAKLEEMGVSVRGKIVIMRYSVPYSYRGYKVYLAESNGAVGSIIYSDPQDDGYRRGETYPRGPWGPPSHIQWGSIVYDWFGFGVTPFTFHWKQAADGTWVEGPERDRQLPRIPSIPMSYLDASEILSRLRGPVVPAEWQGGLPFAYHVGPGPVRIRMQVENDESIATMRNVIGFFRGAEEPEKWVVLGNHRDAWNYGARDPSSGTAALLEAARAVGTAVERGWRPKRSIVFASWDAEEDLLGGSTSWVKDHREKLARDGVVYVNVDSAAAGPDFRGGSTPALADFLKNVTRAVSHPDSSGSVYDAWASRFEEREPEVEIIVGATDYTAFQEHLGMSCIDMSFDGPYGVYHSQYDNYYWMSRIGDPGFRYNTTMARLMAVVVWRLANADVLPLRSSRYARAVLDHLEEIEKKAAPARTISLEAARASARRWEDAAKRLEDRIDQALRDPAAIDEGVRQRVNGLLMGIERAMTEEEGLKSRPFFKHLIYAPQPTYRKEVLPRIFEAIEAGDWSEIERYERQLVDAFDRASALATEAAALLE